MNLGSFIHFSIFLIFSHFEWLVCGVSSGLLHVVWCLVHLGFDIKINVWSDWQVVQAYSISNFVNLSFVVPLWSWHLLPLTQNTLPSKDVREYVFWCYLMPWRSRDLLGVILNGFGIIHFTFFSFFLILSGWYSGPPVGCFMWFGGCSASVLILRLRLRAIGRFSQPIRQILSICNPWSLYGHGTFCL